MTEYELTTTVNQKRLKFDGVRYAKYNFDDVGNRTPSHKSASYGYQSKNKLISTATANCSYDMNGNMVSKGEGSNFWRYAWDYENRLTMASSRKQTVRYLYDALGRRAQRHLRVRQRNHVDSTLTLSPRKSKS